MTVVIESTVKVDRINLQMEKEFFDRTVTIVRINGEKLERFLKVNSPDGVSSKSESLADSWNVEVFPDIDTPLDITNTSSEAFERIVGTPPATKPSAEEIKKVQQWVIANLRVSPQEAARVAGSIIASQAQQGSERYQSGVNFLNLDPDTGEVRRGSEILTTAKRVERDLKQLDLKF